MSLQCTTNTNTTKQWEYHIIAESCSHPDYGTYRTYGIQAFCRQNEQLEPVANVHDVSTQLTYVEQLAQLFTAQQLSPIHLEDVITDFIS